MATDLTKRIVYQNGPGVAIIIPCDCGLTVEQIAQKDVPAGKPYAIIPASDVPADRAARNSWTVNVSDLTSGVGGQ